MNRFSCDQNTLFDLPFTSSWEFTAITSTAKIAETPVKVAMSLIEGLLNFPSPSVCFWNVCREGDFILNEPSFVEMPPSQSTPLELRRALIECAACLHSLHWDILLRQDCDEKQMASVWVLSVTPLDWLPEWCHAHPPQHARTGYKIFCPVTSK